MYVELHARSAFSFLEGASTPEALIAACAAYGMPSMALLDRDGLYGAPRCGSQLRGRMALPVARRHAAGISQSLLPDHAHETAFEKRPRRNRSARVGRIRSEERRVGKE